MIVRKHIPQKEVREQAFEYWREMLLLSFSRPAMSDSLRPHGLQPDLPVPRRLPKFAQVHVHCIGDAISSSDALFFCQNQFQQKEQPTKNDQKTKKTRNHYEDHNFLMLKFKTGNRIVQIEGVWAQLRGTDGNFSCKNPTELSYSPPPYTHTDFSGLELLCPLDCIHPSPTLNLGSSARREVSITKQSWRLCLCST